MWISLTTGWYSVVQHPDDEGALVVRARVRDDLVRLKQAYLPQLGPVQSSPNRDYQWRAAASKADFGAAMAKAVTTITYSNHKAAVERALGPVRAHLLNEVWRVLLALARPAPATSVHRPR